MNGAAAATRRAPAVGVEQPTTPIWAEPRFVVLRNRSSTCVVHLAVRLSMWHTLGIDDAEQALFAQDFSWSYRTERATALHLAADRASARLFGVNIFTISLIRYALARRHLRLHLCHRAPADRATRACRRSRVYSFAAIYLFAFYSHHDLTHTTMMTAMLAVSWYVFVRLAELPTPRLVSRARRGLRARPARQVEFRHVRGGAAARLPAPPRLSAAGADLEDRAGRHRLRRRSCCRPSSRRFSGPAGARQRRERSRRRRCAPISRGSPKGRFGSSFPCSPIRSRCWC